MSDTLVDDLVECLELLSAVPAGDLPELAQAASVAAARPSRSQVEGQRLARSARLLTACAKAMELRLAQART